MNRIWQAYARVISCEIGLRLKFPHDFFSDRRQCIACSGGIDSVCLVLATATRLPVQQLAILHYNHNTRNQETDADEMFVRQLADGLGIDFFSEKRSSGVATEEALRSARYDFFSRTMVKLGSPYLLLAHQADDVIETMFMRLARGSTEIAAPKYRQPFADGSCHLRPLIHIFKQEIIDLFIKNQIPWREDSSNREDKYLRNRIRKLLPELDLIFEGRDWKRGVLLAHRYLEEDAACLQSMAEDLCTNVQKLDLSGVSHDAIIRRAIQFWLRDHSLLRPCFEQIFDAVIQNYSAKISICAQMFVEINRKILCKVSTSTNNFKINFKNWLSGTLYLPTGHQLTREIVSFSAKDLCSKTLNAACIYVNHEKCEKISIRSWQHGDRYRPINAPTKSLKKLFAEKKIPMDRRSLLPVLCDEEGSIIWVPHLPPADFVKVQNNLAIKITFSST
ncbi:MAG: tRNA lysidine(34) synthetase TilS [Puniceicoccales bacterium]|nr:tRNA lysidine(34) synthetase TilS [Puniceicoccales bacterium]